MQKLKYTKSGISYIENVDYWSFVNATMNVDPICDECLKPIANKKFVLVPILSEVYCEKCAKEKLEKMKWYEEDRKAHDIRTYQWCHRLKLDL